MEEAKEIERIILKYQRKLLDEQNENLANLRALQRCLTSIHIQLGNLITLLDSIMRNKLNEKNSYNEI